MFTYVFSFLFRNTTNFVEVLIPCSFTLTNNPIRAKVKNIIFEALHKAIYHNLCQCSAHSFEDFMNELFGAWDTIILDAMEEIGTWHATVEFSPISCLHDMSESPYRCNYTGDCVFEVVDEEALVYGNESKHLFYPRTKKVRSLFTNEVGEDWWDYAAGMDFDDHEATHQNVVDWDNYDGLLGMDVNGDNDNIDPNEQAMIEHGFEDCL